MTQDPRSEASPTLTVLAAGMGSRYGGLKQIDSFGPGGETLLDYSVYDALRGGFGKVVFVIRREIEGEFRAAIGRRFERHVDVSYCFQEINMLPDGFVLPASRKKPWGTTHAILATESQVAGPFAAINADDFYGRNSFRILGEHLRSGTSDDALVGFPLLNTLSEYGPVARGVCNVGSDGYLIDVPEITKIVKEGEKAISTGDGGEHHVFGSDALASMNFWGFQSDVLPLFRRLFSEFLSQYLSSESAELYITASVSRLIAEGALRMKVLRTDDTWFGVTYREDRPSVEAGIRELIGQGAYPERLWE